MIRSASCCCCRERVRVQWPNYDGVPNLNTDWQSFGGWGAANIKQYTGDASVCGADVDLNFY